MNAKHKFDDKYYYIGGKPAFLYAGEFHYFRATKKDSGRGMNFLSYPFETSAPYFYGREYKKLYSGKFVFSPLSVNFIEFENRK